MIKTISLCILALALCGAETAPAKEAAKEAPKVPRIVELMVEDCVEAVKTERAAYDKRIKVPFDATEKMLRALKDSATKAGKTEEAATIQGVIDSFRHTVLTRVDGAAKEALAPDLLGDRDAK